MYVTFPSFLNTIVFIDTYDSLRSRKAIHNWVQNTDLQPDGGKGSNQLALDESVIHINNQQYWLNVASDTETNKSLYVRLLPRIERIGWYISQRTP